MSESKSAQKDMQTPIEIEALRQVSICNACRYCEGFCSVFPAIHRQRDFSRGDMRQLANLCHNCRGCYYACQYTEPHEFKINLPKALANARVESWEDCVWPSSVSSVFQRSGVLLSAIVVVAIALLFLLATYLTNAGGTGFYAYLSHSIMIGIFIPAFALPMIAVILGLRRYWKSVGGEPVKMVQVFNAMRSAASMKNLAGGQGQGCNFESGDRYTNNRRYAHQLTMFGFLLCFASTSAATVMHYLLQMEAPYSLFSIPKLFGLTGGLGLVVGCGWLALLKIQSSDQLGASGVWGGEMAFVVLLGATGVTGLALYAATGTFLVKPLLAIHLGTVLTFFLTLPYSKMVHGFFRLAALVREAQQGSKT